MLRIVDRTRLRTLSLTLIAPGNLAVRPGGYQSSFLESTLQSAQSGTDEGSSQHGGISRCSDAIHFAHANAQALPFHDGQFDAAYCGGALHGFPDPAAALVEIGRTLKPGAPLVVLTFLNRNQPLVRLRRRAEARNDKLVKLHFFEVPELEGMLAQAGFEGFEPLVYGGVVIFRARKAFRAQ